MFYCRTAMHGSKYCVRSVAFRNPEKDHSVAAADFPPPRRVCPANHSEVMSYAIEKTIRRMTGMQNFTSMENDI